MKLKTLLFICLLSFSFNLEAQVTCQPIFADSGLECDTLETWTTTSTTWVFSGDAFEGNQCFEIEGNFNLQYNLPNDGIPVTNLQNASFWTWHEPGAEGIMSTEWGYSDGTEGGECCFSGMLEGWVEIDLLPFMNLTKDLQWLRVWGYSGGSPLFDDITRFDAFNFCAINCDSIDSCGICEGEDVCCGVVGCTDPNACNYNMNAVFDDGSCEYLEIFDVSGNTDPAIDVSETYTYPGDIANEFIWEVDPGTIVNGQGTPTVKVTWDTTGPGVISVNEIGPDSCVGEQVNFDVNVVLTSIFEQNNFEISLFPNPANNKLNLNTSIDDNLLFNIQFTDAAGKLVLDDQIREGRALDIQQLSPGFYNVIITSGEYRYSSPLIIQR